MGTLEPSLSFSVEHDLAQSAKDYSFVFVKGQTFDGSSAEPDRTVGRIGAGLKARFGKGLGLDLKADTTLGGSNGDDRRASAQLSYRF
jgi:outer membrane autotransporter protein